MIILYYTYINIHFINNIQIYIIFKRIYKYYNIIYGIYIYIYLYIVNKIKLLSNVPEQKLKHILSFS